MPTSVANVILPTATPAADPTPTTRNSSRTTPASTDPFQTALAEAQAGIRQTAPADRVDETTPTDPTDDVADETDASELAGVLAAVAQAVVPNTIPANFAQSELLTSGLAPAAGRNGITPQLDSNPTTPPTRSNPLYRQFVSDASPRNNTQLVPPPTPNATPATATPAAATPVAAQTAAAQNPQLLATPPVPTELTAAVNSVQPAQRQVVPPLAAGVLPNAPPVSADDLPDPVVGPQAVVAPAALPAATIGDRPTTAGEQFAAIASAANTIAPAPAVATELTTPTPDLAPALTPLAERGAPTTDADRDRPDASAAAAVASAPNPNAPAAPSAPRQAAAVQPAAPAVQIADAIVTHAAAVERGGVTEFRMRLDPPDLGPVRVRLISSGESIHGQVVVSDDAIRRMIESQLPELRQRLEAAGVTVQSFDVTTDANTGGGGGWTAPRADPPADFARAAEVASRAARASPARGAGVLDVTV